MSTSRVRVIASRARAAFAVIHLVRAPLMVGIVASIVLAVPQQTHELFVITADDAPAHPARVGLVAGSLIATTFTLRSLAVRLLRDQPFATQLSTWFIASLCGSLIPLGAAMGILKAGRRLRSFTLDFTSLDPSLQAAVTSSTQNFSNALALTSTACFLLFIFVWIPPRLYHRGRALRLAPGILEAALVALGIVVLIACSVAPVTLPSGLGALVILMLATAALGGLVTLLSQVYRRTGVPAIACLGIAAVFLSWQNWNDTTFVRVVPRASPSLQVVPTIEAFLAWYKGRGDRQEYERRNEPYPVFVVSAQGGGLYAAHFAATFLARAQDRCPNFSQHVFAVTGVSGGAVGAGLFSGLAKHFASNGPIQDCRFGDIGDGPMEGRVRALLGRDFLSPIVAGALFPDLMRSFIPFAPPYEDRARVFEKSLETAWSGTLPELANPLREPFLSLWSATGANPALVATTTQVENGMRVLVTPFMSIAAPQESTSLHTRARSMRYVNGARVDDGWDALKPGDDITLSSAMGLSARFPWVMPAARFKTTTTEFRLVDGGYLDNSGDETTFDILLELEELRSLSDELADGSSPPKFVVHLITLTDEAGIAPGAIQGFGFPLSPIRAMLSTRPTRSELAKHRVRTLLGSSSSEVTLGTTGDFLYAAPMVQLNHGDFPIPLGWQLSEGGRRLIEAHAGDASRCAYYEVVEDLVGSNVTDGERVRRANEILMHNSCVACSIPYRLMGRRPTGQTPCSGEQN